MAHELKLELELELGLWSDWAQTEILIMLAEQLRCLCSLLCTTYAN